MTSHVRLMLVLAALLTLTATAALRFGTGESNAAVSSTLHASVGPGFVISLTFDDGSAVTALPPGSYRVLVSDDAADHNFHLFGPGVSQETGVEFAGSASWNVTFRSGSRYQFVCDPHAESMFGSFDAGTVADDPTPSGGGGGGGGGGGSGTGGGSSTAGKTLAILTAGVDAAGKLKLTLKGKTVKTLTAGKYTFAVSDSSKKNAVTLRPATGGVAKSLTGLAFVGKKSVGVTLAPGQWKLYPSAQPSSAITFRVTKA